MKNFNKSRAVLSVLLSISMVLGNLNLPLSAFAEELTEPEITITESLPPLPEVSIEEVPISENTEVILTTEELERKANREFTQEFTATRKERNAQKDSDESREGKRRDYVEGEILVKYKDAKINLETSVGQSAAMSFEGSKSLERKEDMRRNNISHLRIRDGKTVEEKIAELKNDPNVEYAQPNYQYYPTAIATNDTHRGLLWGLDNTEQTVNGVTGTRNADIDAPEAWDIYEGTSTTPVIVAVIDSGVAYMHPDLTANMWNGASCVGSDSAGVPISGGCMHGFDFQDNDKTPLPTRSSHGTHIAGTIAAAKNNNKGIIGVAPQAKIMALKSSLTSLEIVKAIDFANLNRARVINASWGDGFKNGAYVHDFLDQALYNSIRDFPGIFVTAAGNDRQNHDSGNPGAMMYPAGFSINSSAGPGLNNMIVVAATDSDDNLADYSDYGVSSVDVGAPGVNIYSTVADSEISENFEGVTPPNVPSGWVRSLAPNPWGVYHFSSGNVLYGDLVSPYANSVQAYITSTTIDLSGASVATIEFDTRCDTEYRNNDWLDYMRLDTRGGGSSIEIAKWDETSLDDNIDSSGSSPRRHKIFSIPSINLASDFRFQFLWNTNATNFPILNYDGCYVDNIVITKFTDGADEQYGYKDGTSMAAPHVAGLAALIWGVRPDLSSADVKNKILNTGDSLSSLNGKTLTGKRINAHAALSSVVTTNSEPATLSLTPATGIVDIGGTSTVSVVVDSVTPFNSVNAQISFDKEYLSVQSVSKNNSALSLWSVDPSFSNNAGTIDFEGGNTSALSGQKTILDITFTGVKSGTSSIWFTTASVLAADGRGTDIVGAKNIAEIVVSAPVATTTPPTPVATTTWSQTVTLSSGWNIVSTPRLLESHVFSAPETLSNFAIYTLDPTRPSKWATMADLGQSEFTPLYGYFINNKTGVPQTLKLQYKASTTPNERLFERTFTTAGWYSFGIANPSYARGQGEGGADANNPDRILNSLLGTVSNYDSVIDFTDASFRVSPDSVALVDPWKSAIRSADVANTTEINALNDFRETKGYAIYIKAPSTLNGFQNNTVPQCADGIDNDGDGLTDYPADDACFSASDNDESPSLVLGSLAITKAADSPSTSIVRGGTAFTLAKFNIQANGERLKVENLKVALATSNASWGSIRNGAIYLDGVQVGSTMNITTSGTTFNFGSAVILNTGTSYVLEVRGDAIDGDGTNDVAVGDTLQVRLLAGTQNVYRLTSFGYASSPAVSANTLTVSGGTLSLAKYATYTNQNVTVPQSSYKIGEYRLTTGNTEGVNLDTFALSIGGSDVTKLQSVYIVYGSKTTATKAVVASTSNTYAVNEPMPANSTMSIAVYASLSGSMTTGQTITPTLTVSGTSQSSGQGVSASPAIGQTITVTTGSLTSAVDASTPISGNVVANSMPKVASFKFTGLNDAFTITQIGLKVGSISDTSAISDFVLKDGATTLSSIPMSGVFATATGMTIAVPYNGIKIIDVYANIASIGTGFANTGANVGVTMDAFKYRNSNGVEATDNTDRQGNAMYAYKSKPTITNVALPTTVLSAGTQTVAKFTITADAGGMIAWRKIRFNVSSTTGITASNWDLRDSANESISLVAVVSNQIVTGGFLEFALTNEQEVSGSKTYVLKTTIGGAVVSGAAIVTSIPATSVSHSSPTDYTSVPSGASFIWSDESVIAHSGTTLDWMNDYLVKSLPTDSQTLTK